MSSPLDRLQYGFDADSRRSWRRNALTTGQDNFYNYDGLGQVTGSALGNLNLNQSAISGVPVVQESWNYDPTGNWRGYSVSEDGAVLLDQNRVHDKGNRLTQVLDDPNPIVLDRVGRMREMPPDATGDWGESLTLKWDPWSRITEVRQVSDGELLGRYSYDGFSRRLTRTVDGVQQHCYYSDAWKPLEERKDSAETASVQYLWGARHRDDLVRRDRATEDSSSESGYLDETRYVLMDYFSPAALTDATGTVTERYAFSAFGVRRILAPDYSPRTESECDMAFAFQGQFLDAESGLYDYGYRYYSPWLGRWTAKDPIGIKGGLNLFAMVGNEVLMVVDRFGLVDSAVIPLAGGGSVNMWTGQVSPMTSSVHPDNDPSNLGEMLLDPYESCLGEGFYRHCVNSCILQHVQGVDWMTMAAAMIVGNDLPWQSSADFSDIFANLLGIGAANANPSSVSCKSLCLDMFDEMVEKLCCSSNPIFDKTSKYCECEDNSNNTGPFKFK